MTIIESDLGQRVSTPPADSAQPAPTLKPSESSPSRFVRREEEWGIKGLREWVVVAFKHSRQKRKMIRRYESPSK